MCSELIIYDYCSHPEFFYPKKFVTVKSAETRLKTSTVSTLCHSTHLDEVKEICAAPNTATFKGSKMKWRPGTKYNEERQTYDVGFCSYTVEDVEEEPKPMTIDSQLSFGPFLWFGTSKKEVIRYGSYCFEFQLNNVLNKYQQSRGIGKKLCYRVGGTLLYRQLVAHVVIVCCEDDEDYQSYPLINGTSTKYFKLAILSKAENLEPPVCKKQKFEDNGPSASADMQLYDVTQDNQTLSSSISSIHATILKNVDSKGLRHEHVSLVFYLPDGITLQLTNEDGKLSKALHGEYCVKTKGQDKTCQFNQFEQCYIDKFNEPAKTD